MDASAAQASLTVLLVGGVLIACLLAKAALRRVGLPALVAYLLLGVALRAADNQAGLLTRYGEEVLSFLGTLGVIALLFRVGLESDLPGLVHQLRGAAIVWFGSVAVSAALGYVAARYVLSFDAIPSLVIATALTATSVGIPAQVWRGADRLDSDEGQRFLDVAEMDDLSGVVLMALLFAVLETVRQSADSSVAPVLARQVGWFALKLGVFAGLCVLFSRYVEERFTRFVRRVESGPDPMLIVVGVGLMVAALAGVLGFSVAIGAFLAGLVFSRDPQSVKVDASFTPLYDLFTPFFFVSVGLEMDLSLGVSALEDGAVLLAAAVVGKLLGTTVPALACTGLLGAAALGVSMVPRAEIAMLIMHRAGRLGPEVGPPAAYAGMVVVCAGTCLLAPPALMHLLRRQPSPS